ncbi:uncharacterized protein A4U43_C09F2570 [Asparagus officinalis]|uniref:NAC domain-containing protein n=1 Tax=Asparagus officinalis TaxID=4686 RepID=A0A5P1E505_ASPOF|nr:NAC domain-containing protein 21/22-like [Asparagus officinalis]XP_020246559.1 NAC domain-containing protein 21/22-like [Asparagus officinalis]ONK57640.1 uncharacterized protein A4U43_C09F2570 [Asparagus officinalis]
MGKPLEPGIISEIDLYKYPPWDLPGCWKISGKDKHITRRPCIIGHKKTLVFYEGRSCREGRTDWVMHEFRLQNEEFVNAGFSPAISPSDVDHHRESVLCPSNFRGCEYAQNVWRRRK